MHACEHRDRSVTALWGFGDLTEFVNFHFADFFGTQKTQRSGGKLDTKGTRFRDPFWATFSIFVWKSWKKSRVFSLVFWSNFQNRKINTKKVPNTVDTISLIFDRFGASFEWVVIDVGSNYGRVITGWFLVLTPGRGTLSPYFGQIPGVNAWSGNSVPVLWTDSWC